MQAFSTKQTSTRTRFARWQKHITLLAGDRGNWNERQAQTGEDLQQRTQIQAERKTKRRWLNLRTRPESYGRQLLMTGPDGLKLKTEKRTGRRAPLLCCGNQIRKSTRKRRSRNKAGRRTRPVRGFKTQSKKTDAAGESNQTLLRI
jgi:hypothetical protein